ncbi:MAG: DUF2142 domain-containing protein [Acidimicrobiia bacterium]|nr:DUF2142 domain-containing protein [Acidimicrobiia bacterium]
MTDATGSTQASRHESPAGADGSSAIGSRSVTAALIGVALVGIMVLSWLLATPPSGGPDEPAHMIRGAAVIRGQLDGEPSEFSASRRVYEIPGWVGHPDPGCFAFFPYEPAACATTVPRPDGEAESETGAWKYQVWGHLLPGAGTLAPASIGTWAARALDAALPVVVVGLAFFLALRRGRLMFAGVLLAVTPLAWFMFAVVNPSGLVIAGGVGLWVGLALLARHPDVLTRWLVAVSWALMTLPRRDGLLWAVLILAVVMLVDGATLRSLWRGLGPGPVALAGTATLATLAWAAMSDVTSVELLLLTPFVPIAVDAGRWAWNAAWMAGHIRKFAATIAVVAVGAFAIYIVMDRREGGYDADVMRIVIGRTGLHLNEAIGMLGWLDTPIPTSLAFAWLVGLGVLSAGAIAIGDRRLLAAAGLIVVTGVLASWVLEMAQGDPTGTYWQGRYYLPFLVGIPIMLGRARLPDGFSTRLANALVLLALVVPNVALAAAMRRWSVGLAGSMFPWDWNTYNSPVPPVVLLAMSVAASVGLWTWARRLTPTSTGIVAPGEVRE